MKTTEYTKELRSLDDKGLMQRVQELQTAVDRARVDAAFGQAKSHQLLGQLRRQLAQSLTIQSERRLIAEENTPEETK